MLDGRYPSSEFGDLRPRIVWDRVAGTIRARRGARQLAVTNAGTIPDRGLFTVTLPDGRRVGELDEEMVYEARPGQTFLLGASSWRIEEIGLESDAIWSDDGIIVHLPDADEPPGAGLVLVEPDEVEERVVAELGASALFGARFRENAARALLIPRAYPGKRTPLWQQRLKSQSLLEVAKRYGEFPIVLET